MPKDRDLFKEITGESWDQWTKIDTIPPIDVSIDRMYKQNRSRYPLRTLGHSLEGELLVSEEERESHMHIIGTTGEGKSKFLEHLVRGDIDNGNGVCFLDPSDRGDTMYKILAYCSKIGHKKVLVIDPRLDAIAPINPFLKNKEASVTNVSNTLQVLFDMKDMAHFSFIQQYLPSLLSVLYNAKCTLYEAKYFTRYNNSYYRSCRDQILSQSDPLDDDRITIEEAFSSPSRFVDFGSTARRLLPACRGVLGLVFGSRNGIDFNRLIADGWVLLVNLYSSDLFESIQARLLGTMVINQIIAALDRLAYNDWKGRYYLYIDEAGFLANRKMIEVLTQKRKSGLSLIFAHQYYGQIEDPFIRNGIKALTKIRVAFNQPDPQDRLDVVKMMFGGELADRDVSYALSNLKKQHAVIKKSKRPPMIVRIPHVSDINKPSQSYLEKLYSKDVYTTPREVLEEQKQRINEVHYESRSTGKNTPRSERRKKNDGSPTRPDSIPRGDETVIDLFSKFSTDPRISPRLPDDPAGSETAGSKKRPARKEENPSS